MDKLGRSSRIYANHLATHGAAVTYRTYERANHGFYCFAGPEGDALRADVIRFFADVEATHSRTPVTSSLGGGSER